MWLVNQCCKHGCRQSLWRKISVVCKGKRWIVSHRSPRMEHMGESVSEGGDVQCLLDHHILAAADLTVLADHHHQRTSGEVLGEVVNLDAHTVRVRAEKYVTEQPTMTGDMVPARYSRIAGLQQSGTVTPAQVDRLIIEMLRLSRVASITEDQLVAAEQILTDHARLLTPAQIGQLAGQIKDRIDPDGDTPDDEWNEATRRANWGTNSDGTVWFNGRFTVEAGAAITTVLDSLSRRNASPDIADTRSAEQRRHDAVGTVFTRALNSGDLPATGGTPATVIITMTEEQRSLVVGRRGCPMVGRSRWRPDSGWLIRPVWCRSGSHRPGRSSIWVAGVGSRPRTRRLPCMPAMVVAVFLVVRSRRSGPNAITWFRGRTVARPTSTSSTLMVPLLSGDVDDLSVAGQGTLECQGHSVGALDVGGGDCLDMNMRFSAVARVPAACEHRADLHTLSRPNFQAALLEMAKSDHCTLGLDEHVVAGKGQPPCLGSALLGEGVADGR